MYVCIENQTRSICTKMRVFVLGKGLMDDFYFLLCALLYFLK